MQLRSAHACGSRLYSRPLYKKGGSFGVLMLVVLTGRIPSGTGDGENVHILTWVSSIDQCHAHAMTWVSSIDQCHAHAMTWVSSIDQCHAHAMTWVSSIDQCHAHAMTWVSSIDQCHAHAMTWVSSIDQCHAHAMIWVSSIDQCHAHAMTWVSSIDQCHAHAMTWVSSIDQWHAHAMTWVSSIDQWHAHAMTWAEDQLSSNKPASLKDPGMDAPDDAVLRLAQLALSCTVERTASRPKMTGVANELQKIRNEVVGTEELSAAIKVDEQAQEMKGSSTADANLQCVDNLLE
ncbi:unnamed protein product [Closterium sp. Yama58-4]|nr:unnamed protein product [Closterium sp. Yama58-4]